MPKHLRTAKHERDMVGREHIEAYVCTFVCSYISMYVYLKIQGLGFRI